MSEKDIELAAAMMTNVRSLAIAVVECLLKENREQSVDAAGATIAQLLALEAKLNGRNTIEAVSAFQSKWNEVVKQPAKRTQPSPFSLN